jgi:apolipoprotein N-acyltransferase
VTARSAEGVRTRPAGAGPGADEPDPGTGDDGRSTPGRSRRRWERGRVATPSVVAGLAIAFSLPPWGWWPLAFVGAALLYWRLTGLGWRARALAGWLAGMGCFVPGLWWAASFNWYGAVVLMAVESVSMAVAALAVPPARWRAPAYAGAFTLLEAVRVSWPFGGLPLGGVFLGQAGGPLLGTARLGGPLLMTGLVWLGGAALAELAELAGVALAVLGGAGPSRRRSERAGPRRASRVSVVGAVIAGFGMAALVVAVGVAGASAPDGGPAVGTLRVASVQGGGQRGVSATETDPSAVLAAQVAATAMIGPSRPGRRPALVVWPEDVISVGPHLSGTPQAALMAALARRLDATVVAGVTETVSATAFRNEAVAWGPNGRIVGVYEKVHRVPFGEYVPDRSFFAHFASLSAVPLDAIPGHGTGLLHTPAAPIGLMLSYEVFFADRGRSAVRAGARLLVVPTNTSSYATSQVPSNEVAADRVQAVEEGRDLVQAAPAGYSAVVTNQGRVVAQSSLGRRQVLVATVALHSGHTVYEELGDLPVLVLAGVGVATSLGLSLGRRKRRRAGPLRKPGMTPLSAFVAHVLGTHRVASAEAHGCPAWPAATRQATDGSAPNVGGVIATMSRSSTSRTLDVARVAPWAVARPPDAGAYDAASPTMGSFSTSPPIDPSKSASP